MLLNFTEWWFNFNYLCWFNQSPHVVAGSWFAPNPTLIWFLIYWSWVWPSVKIQLVNPVVLSVKFQKKNHFFISISSEIWHLKKGIRYQMKNFIKKKLRKKNYLQQEYFRTLVFTNQLLSPGRDRLGAFYCIFFYG